MRARALLGGGKSVLFREVVLSSVGPQRERGSTVGSVTHTHTLSPCQPG